MIKSNRPWLMPNETGHMPPRKPEPLKRGQSSGGIAKASLTVCDRPALSQKKTHYDGARWFPPGAILQDDLGHFAKYLRRDGPFHIRAVPLKGHSLFGIEKAVLYADNRVTIFEEGSR